MSVWKSTDAAVAAAGSVASAGAADIVGENFAIAIGIAD